MSPVWMQYDEAKAHRLSVPQRPEQHSPSVEHVFPAVVHDELPIGWHVWPLQFPVQHTLPATGQACPIEMHCAVPQEPLTHALLQQSVFAKHGAVAGAHVVTDDAHL
jgi:hypothetical protein